MVEEIRFKNKQKVEVEKKSWNFLMEKEIKFPRKYPFLLNFLLFYFLLTCNMKFLKTHLKISKILIFKHKHLIRNSDEKPSRSHFLKAHIFERFWACEHERWAHQEENVKSLSVLLWERAREKNIALVHSWKCFSLLLLSQRVERTSSKFQSSCSSWTEKNLKKNEAFKRSQ